MSNQTGICTKEAILPSRLINGRWGYICPICNKFVSMHDAWYQDGFQKHFECLYIIVYEQPQ